MYLLYASKQVLIWRINFCHWVHLRCTGIHQAQYTDTWTFHQHRKSRLTRHTDIAPPHPPRPWTKPHTLTAHTHATQTTVHTSQSQQQPHAQHRVLRQPHKQTKDYHRTTNTTGPAVKVREISSYCKSQKQTRGAQTAYSRHRCRHHHNSGNQAHP